MIKKLLTALVLAGLCASCVVDLQGFNAAKEQATKQVATAGFERIELKDAINVVYTQGDSTGITLIGPAKQLENIDVKVSNSQLTISSKQYLRIGLRLNKDADQVTVSVVSPDLTAVTLAGSGCFKTEGVLDTDTLNVCLKGSGDMDFGTILCDRLSAELIGSGDMDFDNVTTQQAVLSLVGSGDMEARLSQVKNTVVKLLGSGDIGVHFDRCQTADCRLRGPGDIELSGNLEHFSSQINGSGDIDTEKLTVKK